MIIGSIARELGKESRRTVQARDALQASDRDLKIKREDDKWVYLQ